GCSGRRGAESACRIDSRWPKSGDKGGQYGAADEKARDQRQSQRIVRFHSIEEIGKERSRTERTCKANRHTGQREDESLAQYEPQYLSRLRPQCHAEPNFVPALANGIRNNAIYADSRQ